MVDRTWVFLDYNQAESRVVAWKGPVPKLKKWYSEGVDVHSYVCQAIAKVVQENKIPMPPITQVIDGISRSVEMFKWKPWAEYTKGVEEREMSKRIVHGSNYDMSFKKLALILGVSEETAKILHKIYMTLFPEIKTNYQVGIERTLRETRTLIIPDPVKFRIVFQDINSYTPIDPETLRSAYSRYAQATVGGLLNRAFDEAASVFAKDENEEYKEQWCVWYGKENWDDWRYRRMHGLRDPKTILQGGMDIRLNVHDAGGISTPHDSDIIKWTITKWKEWAEVPVKIGSGNELIIPVETKVGKTWGSEDLKDFKL